MKRDKTGIDVLAYHPFTARSNEAGWVKAAYRLAIMTVGGSTFLIDEFGMGVGPIEDLKKVYQQPVYQYNENGSGPIDFRAPIAGCFPIGKDLLNGLDFDKSMDLAHFIRPGPDCDHRLERWAQFWGNERARSTGE
jgi:hypothetical protein